MPRFTVIVPTYHRPAFLERTLASIAAQRQPPAEVIVVEDEPHVSEGIRSIVSRARLPNAHVVPNRRGRGASGARNSGAGVATGDLLAFLDDDDEWLPDFLARVAPLWEQGDLDIVCTDLINRDPDGTERPGKTAPDRLVPEAFFSRNPGLGGSNLIIRRSVYFQVGGFDESLLMMEDLDLGIRLSLVRGLAYAPLHERLVRRHLHDEVHLAMPRTLPTRTGVRRFYQLHSHRMTVEQRLTFRTHVMRLWGVDESGELLSQGAA